MDGKITLIHSSMPTVEEYTDAIRPLWETLMLTNNGGMHLELARKLTDYLGVTNLNLFVNGHMALQLVLEAMVLHGEVITTPFTFASTTHAIVRCGLTPVFCDIREDDCNIDPDGIEPLITERTCAILPVHIYGNACDVDRIGAIADKHGLKVVYDAAQAFGVRIRERGVGTFGHASTFSFNATKSFHTVEGGAAACDDAALSAKLTKLANYGKNLAVEYGMEMIGVNGKLNEFQAAMGLCLLRIIDGELAKRRNADRHYRDRIVKIPGIRPIPETDRKARNCTYFPVCVDEALYGESRDALAERLLKANISSKKYFTPVMPDLLCYKGKFDHAAIPVARRMAERVLALPMHASLSEADVDRVCDVLEKRR